MKLRYAILWIVAVVALGSINYSIVQRENLIDRGDTIFLALAPFDPRSLIQGDYMALRYEVGRQLENQDDLAPDGYLVLKLDENNIARLARVYDGQTPLAAGERLLRYRKRGQNLRLGAESFFFQEGQGEYYDDARYAELRIDTSGESILVDLRGPDLELRGPVENRDAP